MTIGTNKKVSIRPIWPEVHIEECDGEQLCKNIEKYGRLCYRSEAKITDKSYIPFLKSIIERGHESVLEHEKITVKFICSRSVSHELIRHRIASYSQVSQRYVNYSRDTFENKVPVIIPFYLISYEWWKWDKQKTEKYNIWYETCNNAAVAYFELLNKGCKPEEARAVLPNSTATEIVITANIREWRHILKLRTSPQAFIEMKQIMTPLLYYLQDQVPVLFEDIIPESWERRNIWAHVFVDHSNGQLEVIRFDVES